MSFGPPGARVGCTPPFWTTGGRGGGVGRVDPSIDDVD